MVLPSLDEMEIRRKHLGLTQLQLASAADVSRSSLAKIELAYRAKSSTARAGYVPNYEDAKRIFEVLETEEEKRRGGIGLQIASILAHAPVLTAHRSDKVLKCKELMKEHNYSQLPVVENDACVGSLTETSILAAIEKLGSVEKVYDNTVSKIMAEPFPVISENTSAAAIIPLVKQAKAVLTNRRGKIVGIITAFDIMQ